MKNSIENTTVKDLGVLTPKSTTLQPVSGSIEPLTDSNQ